MPFCGTQNISVLRAEIKLGVAPNGIPKVDFAIALNRILSVTLLVPTATIRLLLRHSRGGVQAWAESDFKDFLKIFDENIHDTHCQY
jgi:hypothetical protein